LQILLSVSVAGLSGAKMVVELTWHSLQCRPVLQE